MGDNETKTIIPAVPLRGGAVFPDGMTTISVGRERSLAAAKASRDENVDLLVLVQYVAEMDEPTADDVATIGILAKVRDLIRTPQHGVQMLVELKHRVRFTGFTQTDPYLLATYEELEPIEEKASEELIHKAIAHVEEYAHMMGEVNRQILSNLRDKNQAGELADYIAGLLNIPLETEIELLETLSGVKRLERVIQNLEKEIQIADIRNQIQQEAREGAEKAQREYMLREQMRAIRKELGEDSATENSEFLEKIKDAGMPEKTEQRALKELAKLERTMENSAEGGVLRNYLEWLVELPWDKASPDNFDVDHVRAVLDDDHYGLDDVKDRIVEYVAVRQLAGNKMRGAIINLNGAPGVGKTSIASSVAKAVGREMCRISLGGVRDEAEIRGHRRTYIGAIPGRIIRALRDAKTNNPVIVLDEIDKVGSDWRGDPSSALLEVLDPEQNHSFTDHYLEVPFDLSQAIFITTSNTLRTIPAPLRDRMETIDMSGYIEDEKISIAEKYLIRKQKEGHGIADQEFTVEPSALRKLIRYYTYEAGVRQLERHIGTLVRKTAVKVARGESGPFVITDAEVEEYLGPEKFSFGKAEEQDEIGVVTGLAVVGFGSDTLSIEIQLSEGGGKLSLTGSLGNVMKESAQTALTYARSHARELGLDPKIFDKTNIHIHVPAGAIPKDGPSAGIALTTAIVSAFTNRPVRKDVAMTGEVTLRGKVLPIGGLKAKTLAAHRAGIKTVIFPQENSKDIPELAEKVRENLELITASDVRTVLDIALLEPIGEPYGLHLLKDPSKSVKELELSAEGEPQRMI